MSSSASENIWQYQPRSDGVVSVTLDNNVWDWLYAHRDTLRLREALPANRFALFVPREVEIEHLAISAHNQALHDFIIETRKSCGIRTNGYFGFGTVGSVQRSLGFNGTFMSDLDRARLEEMRPYIGRSAKGSGLAKHETDVMLALLAFHSVVLTLDNDGGPLGFARKRGGKILDINAGHVNPGYLADGILAILSPAAPS